MSIYKTNPMYWLIKLPIIRDRIREIIITKAAKQFTPDHSPGKSGDVICDKELLHNNAPFALYIHFPFCSSSCNYCIFRKTLKTSLITQYVDAVIKEMELMGQWAPLKGRSISSVYLGGGTPSLVPISKLNKILSSLNKHFQFTNDVQITLEGNPESLNPKSVDLYYETGINRISIGVQSLNDDLLKKMGRKHTADNAINTIKGFLDNDFCNLSADLIYGFGSLENNHFLNDVQRLAELGVPHITAFPLIEKSILRTRKKEHRHIGKERRETYTRLVDYLGSEGYEQYSIEDFSKTDKNRCKYQMDAWAFPKKDVIGMGAASLSSIAGHHYSNQSDLNEYFSKLKSGQLPMGKISKILTNDEATRSVLLGSKFLHVNRAAFNEHYNLDFHQALEPLLSTFKLLGIWKVDKSGINLTLEGMQIISEIWSELILANLADAAKVESA